VPDGLMNTAIDMRYSIDSIKAELGKGEVVTRGRQTGKTVALMEFIHEYCSGFCYIVVPNFRMAEWTEHQYRHLFPDDEKPLCVPLGRLGPQGTGTVKGRPLCWVTDEVWPGAAEQREEELRRLTFLGGVGTPYCMDMHSQ
jgi:hypothetical protein